jgi:hypothetical protein
MMGVKGFARLQHSESDMNKLTHGCPDELHFIFAVLLQTLTETAHHRIVLFGDYKLA